MTTENMEAIICDVMEKRIGVPAAAGVLGVTTRTIWRRVARYRARGAAGFVHGLVGKPSNRAMPEGLRQRVTEIFRGMPHGTSLAAFIAVLKKDHGIGICRETARKWLMAAGIWTPQTAVQCRLDHPATGDVSRL